MHYIKKTIALLLIVINVVCVCSVTVTATCQQKIKTLPSKYGSLISNAWRTTGEGSISGNTRQWDYQVSAVYKGSKTVKRIRSTWRGHACLKNSASISLGISGSGISASCSSSWQSVNTVAKYWENTNGAKSSSWRSNMYCTPKDHYLNKTVSIANTALVKLSCDSRTFEITASA